MPGTDVVGGQAVGACEEEDAVARARMVMEPVEDVVAYLLQGPAGGGESLPERAGVAGENSAGAGQQGVGVEGQDTALGQREGALGERWPLGAAQRRSVG
ncbi:hypothetical protein ACWC2T_21900 [Streptomyces sp. NPDC001393]